MRFRYRICRKLGGGAHAQNPTLRLQRSGWGTRKDEKQKQIPHTVRQKQATGFGMTTRSKDERQSGVEPSHSIKAGARSANDRVALREQSPHPSQKPLRMGHPKRRSKAVMSGQGPVVSEGQRQGRKAKSERRKAKRRRACLR